MSVDSNIDLNESTKCGEKFSEDFPMCIKIVENTRINNHSKRTRIYVETQKEKITGERDSTLIQKNYKQRLAAL